MTSPVSKFGTPGRLLTTSGSRGEETAKDPCRLFSLIHPATRFGGSISSFGETGGDTSWFVGLVVFRLMDASKCGSPRRNSACRNSHAPGSGVVANKSFNCVYVSLPKNDHSTYAIVATDLVEPARAVSNFLHDTDVTHEYMFSCLTNDCQLLCLKNRGKTTLMTRSVNASPLSSTQAPVTATYAP